MEDAGNGRRPRRESRPLDSFAKLYERPLPFSLEAEMALLGAMILDPKVVPDVMSAVGGAPDFYNEAHATIYSALIDVYDRVPEADLVAIVDALRDRDQLEQVGGVDFLSKLATETPSSAGALRYARIVADKAKLRKLIDAADRMIYDALNVGQYGIDGAREVIDSAESAVFEIAQEDQKADPQALAELLEAELERIRSAEGKGITGLATGFVDLDRLMSGLQPGEMVIVAARPSMGKCLAFDAELVLEDGSVVTIEEICRRQAGRVPSLGDDLRIGMREPSAFVDDGIKPVFEVTTRLGRRVRTTLTHPFLTVSGWKRLEELSVGDAVAVPRKLGVFGHEEMRECEVKLLAYLIGDGGLTGTIPRFTNSNTRIAADFESSVAEFGGVVARPSEMRPGLAPSWRISGDRELREERRGEFASKLEAVIARSGRTNRAIATAVGVSPALVTMWTQGVCTPEAGAFERLCVVLEVGPEELAPEGPLSLRKNTRNALTRWLAELGLMGCDSYAKRVPAPVFRLERRLVALFLNRLFATDGWATVLTSGQPQLGYASVSERLARQVQHLLLRFGVVGSLVQKWVKYKEARRASWQLNITDAESMLAFIEEIGIYGKEPALERVGAALEGRRRQTNTDLVPVEVWDQIEEDKGELSWRALSQRIGAKGDNLHVRRRGVSRRRLGKIAAAIGSSRLAALASSDVYWDRIVSVEPLGEQQVYDLTIPGTHNFIADDVCVHNTAFALNLSEQVARGGRTPTDPPKGPHAPVGIFSLEMSKGSLVQRLLSAAASVDSHRMRTGHLSEQEMATLHTTAEMLQETPIYIDDTPGLTVLALRARARRMVAQHGVKALVVDYLQLLSAPGSARESRQVEVSSISRSLKALARELKVPVVCLSQLNRASEQREGNRPRMSDLRESGSIEQDADVVVLLHREDYYHLHNPQWAEENPDKVNTAELIIAKQRNGPTGTVNLTWDPKTTRFKNHAGYHGGFDGGGYGGGTYSGPSPFDTEIKPSGPQVAPATPARGGFPAGSRTGPIEGHRDGGGPDREELDDLGDLPV